MMKLLKWLALAMLCVTLIWCVSAQAETSGTCGENLTWVLDDDGVLTISGEGEMTSFTFILHLQSPHQSFGSLTLRQTVTNA